MEEQLKRLVGKQVAVESPNFYLTGTLEDLGDGLFRVETQGPDAKASVRFSAHEVRGIEQFYISL